MTEPALAYPDYRWRRWWRLGNSYVISLLALCAASITSGPILHHYDLATRQEAIGMILIPGFIALWTFLLAGMNSLRLALDQRYGTEDSVGWPSEKPKSSFWSQCHGGSFPFHFSFIRLFYVYDEGFGWVGGAVRRAFVPWECVDYIEQGWFNGEVQYTRNGRTTHMRLISVKPLLKVWKADA